MLQNQVYSEQAKGLPGQISKAEHQNMVTLQCVCIDDCKPGDLVFAKVSGTAATNGGLGQNIVTTSGAAENGTAVYGLGFVVRDNLINSCGDTDIYPAGTPITVLIRGSIFIKAEVNMPFCQYLTYTANSTSGAITWNSRATTPNPAYFNWLITQEGAVGDICEITKM